MDKEKEVLIEEYINVCVLKRCGALVGPDECCEQIIKSGLKQLVLDHLWTTIKKENCAQYCAGHCLSRKYCDKGNTYCYPIPLRKRRANRTVAVMFAYYCAERAAAYAADAADYAAAAAGYAASAADAAAEASAARAAADAAGRAAGRAAGAAASAASAARAAGYAADAAAYAAAAAAAADTAAYAAYAAAREEFYRAAAEELIRLIDAWGDED